MNRTLNVVDKKISYKSIEILFVTLFFLILLLLLIRFVPSSPISSDIQLYHDIGIKGLKDPFVLNRYFHIYLQRFFTAIADSPTEGMGWFWAFLVSGTTVLVYFVSKKISKSDILVGLIAVAFFISSDVIPDFLGVNYVDVTAMFLGMVILACYVQSLDKKYWLILLGIVMFLGFKTKETTLPITAVIILFGWYQDKFDFKLYWVKVRLVLMGLLIGMLIFGVLNLIFVNDFLFGFRPKEIKAFIDSYVPEPGITLSLNSHDSWYYSFWLKHAFLLFFFYVLSGYKAMRRNNFGIRILWLIPLSVTFFILLSINNRWGFLGRFILPALPIMCVLAAQFFDFNLLKGTNRWTLSNASFSLVSFTVTLVLLTSILVWSRIFSVNLSQIFFVLILPILFTLILGLIFISDGQLILNILLVSLVLLGLAFPFGRNVLEIVETPTTYQDWIVTARPIFEFSNLVVVTEDMVFCADPVVFENMPVPIVKNIDELVGIFNIVIGSNASRSNFKFDHTDKMLSQYNSTEICTYILTHKNIGEKNLSNNGRNVVSIEGHNYLVNPSVDNEWLFYVLE